MKKQSYPEFLETPEKFIPFRMSLLLDKLLENRPEEDARGLRRLHRMLADRFHLEFHEKLLKLRDKFIPITPDRDTRAEPVLSREEQDEVAEELIEEIQTILGFCNFVPITESQINQCLTFQPLGGLRVEVDTTKFSHFHIYYRGCERYTPTPNRWSSLKKRIVDKCLFFKRRSQQPEEARRRFKKVFLLLRQKDAKEQTVILKLYRDVPVENLKIIIPDASVKLTPLDICKISGTVLVGLVTSAMKLALAAVISWFVLLIFLVTLMSTALKGLTSFINSKTKQIGSRSQELLYQNLSNNISSISSLITMAEEQEVKEIFLAYVELLDHPGQWQTVEEIDREVEAWLEKLDSSDKYKPIDFEEQDAIRKIKEKALVDVRQDSDGKERYRAVDLATALNRLTAAWTRYTIDGTFG